MNLFAWNARIGSRSWLMSHRSTNTLRPERLERIWSHCGSSAKALRTHSGNLAQLLVTLNRLPVFYFSSTSLHLHVSVFWQRDVQTAAVCYARVQCFVLRCRVWLLARQVLSETSVRDACGNLQHFSHHH